MLGPNGLVAYIVTLHQPTLIAAMVIGALSLLPYAIVMRGRRGHNRFLWATVLFLGVTLSSHSLFSWLQGFSALSVEIVQIGRTPDDPPPP